MNDIDEINEEDKINTFIYYGNFYIDRKYSYYKRSFTKAFQSLSIIIAFYKILYVIFNFISSFCNEFLLLETIMINTKENLVKRKSLSYFINKYNFSNVNYMNNYYNEQSKILFKNHDNNINILNINSKENNNVLSNKENEMKQSIDHNIKKIINKERNNKLNKVINLDINPSKSQPIYRPLLLYIFRFFLTEKKKYEYQINNMNRKVFKKRLDIYNYLNLLKRVDFLFEQIIKSKNKK